MIILTILIDENLDIEGKAIVRGSFTKKEEIIANKFRELIHSVDPELTDGINMTWDRKPRDENTER